MSHGPRAICDRCGFEFWFDQLRKEWTGLMVCSSCWDPRHPQEFVRGVRDNQGVRPNMRPEPADVFVTTGVVQEWDGVTRFNPGATPGISILPMAYHDVTPITSASWSDFMTAGRWAQVEAIGPSHIRIPFDPTPMLATDTSNTALEPFITLAREAIDDCLARGFKVLFNVHVGAFGYSNPSYNDSALRTAYAANSALWMKAEVVWGAFGILMNDYATADVGFEIYNETTASSHAIYGPMLQRLETVVRARTERTTIIFSPCSRGAPDKFVVSGFTASMFGANSGFAVHSYIPVEFVYQGLSSGYLTYITDLNFPADTTDEAAAITRMTNGINASSLTDKAAQIATGTTQLEYYFDNYEGSEENGPYDFFFGSQDGLDAGSCLGLWIDDNGVDASQIFVTEFGAGTNGSRSSRYNFLRLNTNYWDAFGWNRAAWVEDDTSFSLRTGGDFDPLLLASMGFTYDGPQWLEGADLGWNFSTDAYYNAGLISASAAYTFTRSTTKVALDTAGEGTSFAIDALARTDKGALIEPAATNKIRNPEMSGASAPSTMPTNYSGSSAGLTRTVVGTGTSSGRTYLDVRYNGTSNGSAININMESSTQVVAASGETWTLSFAVKAVAGTLTNVTGIRAWIDENTSGGVFVTGNGSTVTPFSTSSITAIHYTRTLNGGATVARIMPIVKISTTNGAAIDFTLRLYAPMLETGSTATSTYDGTRGVDALILEVPAGTYDLMIEFSDDTRQMVYGQVGDYAVPTDLSSPYIKKILGIAV